MEAQLERVVHTAPEYLHDRIRTEKVADQLTSCSILVSKENKKGETWKWKKGKIPSNLLWSYKTQTSTDNSTFISPAPWCNSHSYTRRPHHTLPNLLWINLWQHLLFSSSKIQIAHNHKHCVDFLGSIQWTKLMNRCSWNSLQDVFICLIRRK